MPLERRGREILWTRIPPAVLAARFAGWLVLAIWLSGFARGFYERLVRKLGREQEASIALVNILIF